MPSEGSTAGCPASRLAFYLLLALLVLLLDLGSKALVEARLHPGQVITVTPFFNLVLTYNPGAAFSFLSDASGWQRWLFSGIAMGASVLIVYLLRRHCLETLFSVALALILGGALGNLWDRLALGHVVDFLDIHAWGRHWPAFNVADSAITVGAAILILESFMHRDETGA